MDDGALYAWEYLRIRIEIEIQHIGGRRLAEGRAVRVGRANDAPHAIEAGLGLRVRGISLTAGCHDRTECRGRDAGRGWHGGDDCGCCSERQPGRSQARR